MQEQQDATKAKQEAKAWAGLIQQLSSNPVDSPFDGQSVVASTVQHAQKLEEQQRRAFEDLASKDEALSNAESKLGQCLLHVHALYCLRYFSFVHVQTIEGMADCAPALLNYRCLIHKAFLYRLSQPSSLQWALQRHQ